MPNPPHRRAVTLALAATALGGAARPDASLARLLNPASGLPMASAGIIARRGDGLMAAQAAAGLALGPKAFGVFARDAPFRVASVSKMITTAAFLPLAQRMGVSLDSDASEHLGFELRHPAHRHTPITVRMLLSHLSGLRNGPSYPVPLGHRLAEAFTPDGRHFDQGAWFGPPQHAPGTWFAYADVNFALIAQIMERLSGRRFDLYMHETLFAPLKLDIGYNWSGVSAAKRGKAAAGLRWLAGKWTPQVDAPPPPFPEISLAHAKDAPNLSIDDYQLGENGFLFSPLGGLRLSLNDMDRLARVFAARGKWRGAQIVSNAALDAMATPAWTLDPEHRNGDTDEGVFQSYGLGMQTPSGRPGPLGDAFFGGDTADWRGHLGDAYGWMTGLFWNIKDRRTLVWAVNGMPETGRPVALRSSLTAPEEALVRIGLAS